MGTCGCTKSSHRRVYLYVSVREQQVHDDVLREDLGVVDAELDARELLRQLLSLVLLPRLPDVVQQRVLEGGTAADGERREAGRCEISEGRK